MDFCPESAALCHMIRGKRRVSGGRFHRRGAFIASCSGTGGGLVQQALKVVDEGSATDRAWRGTQSRRLRGKRHPPNGRGAGKRKGCRCQQARIGFRGVLSLNTVTRTDIECSDRILRGGANRLETSTAAPVSSGRGRYICSVREASRETRANHQGQRRNEQHGVQAPRDF